MSSFPIWHYHLPGGILILTVVLYALEQKFSHTSMWRKIPWGVIAIATVIFMVGQIYADLLNPRSDLRNWYRNTGANFDVVSLPTDHEMGERERIEMWCLIRFREDMSNPLLVVRVTTLLPNDRRRTTVVMQKRLGEVVRDTSHRFQLGEIAIPKQGSPPRTSAWGDGEVPIIRGSENIVTLSVNNFSRRIYVKVIDPQREDMKRVFIVSESEAPFDSFH